MPKIIEKRTNGARDPRRQTRIWMDDVKEWTGMSSYGEIRRLAQDRETWRDNFAKI